MWAAKSLAADRIPINIAAIDWCPQICPQARDPGYIIDIVEEVFRSSPYEPVVRIYPWSRAIQYVRNGRAHALLSPAKAEAPDLVYPEQEIGIQSMCFFVLKDSPWTYEGNLSLEGHLTGLASDTSIEELNSLIEDRSDLFFVQPYSDEYIQNSVNMLRAGRVNSFLFTYNTTLHILRTMGAEKDIRSAGCVSNAKVYMAFSPAPGLSADVDDMVTYFDRKMRKFKAEGGVKEVMTRYGLADWNTDKRGDVHLTD
ncbi:ABC transporter substrate-binding protein [Labrenzia sp. VG12]|uniref:substrate-binding periplasmic protein n=1 Tax=Labrenzia sp. VG12 TaxID=2021862 RepID=UPI000B8BDB04|nr:transporter substrate-binding domain-containing protein [Labrenzia sp. VG12]ASP35995.1 hypothetical protein CHH27_24365 [Labrenzia sp. VG12]